MQKSKVNKYSTSYVALNLPLWQSQENELWGQRDKEAGIWDTLMRTHNQCQLIVNWFTSVID